MRVPEDIRELRYTPVSYDPLPFTVDVDLDSMKVVKRTVGVIPNANYPGQIYKWDELCEKNAAEEQDG